MIIPFLETSNFVLLNILLQRDNFIVFENNNATKRFQCY